MHPDLPVSQIYLCNPCCRGSKEYSNKDEGIKMGRKRVIGTGAYSFTLFKTARKEGAKVRSARGSSVEVRRMHRDDLTSWIEEGHLNDGVVTDPRSINPYRGKCYGNIVSALQTKLPSSVKNTQGEVSSTGTTIKEWNEVVEGSWADQDVLFDIASEINPALRKNLRARKNNRSDVENHVTDVRMKFGNNIKTLQRTTGVTPYGLPLSQACMTIDSRWVLKDGFFMEEFRLVVGRREPQKEDGRVAMKRLMKAVERTAKRKRVAKRTAKAVAAEAATQTAELVPI